MPTYEFPRPIATVDVVLLTVAPGGVLEVALVPRRIEPHLGQHALPGTYVHEKEDADLEAATRRVLAEKCGVEGVFLEQLFTFGGQHRDPRGWAITVAFWALVPHAFLDGLATDGRVRLAKAIGLTGLPFDHDAIVAMAVERVRGKSTYTTLPLKLLPPTFTLAEAAHVYGTVLGRDVDDPNFRQWLTKLQVFIDGGRTPFLIDTGEVRGGRRRPAAIFRAATDAVTAFPQRF